MAATDEIDRIEADGIAHIQTVDTRDELEALRVQILGKKGSLTQILRSMGSLSPEERPQVGKRANEVRAHLENEIEAKRAALAQADMQQQIEEQSCDITLPGRRHHQGKQHIISQIVEEIEDIFCGLGFSVEDGPYVETTYYNFEALNAPEDHPSRSARDTFYLDDHKKEYTQESSSDIFSSLSKSELLLRTQTSGVQVHTMEEQKPPIFMIAPGTVFRPDTPDANHLPQFTQIEGLVVAEGITFADLKGTLDYFCREIFGKDRATRYRPHFFPFTEPSCEVDVSCGVCGGKGCRFCKHTGWLEILGAGMVDPNVLDYVGIDHEKYTGFAFGIGAERVAALRYDIPDLRMLMTGDMRLLRQF